MGSLEKKMFFVPNRLFIAGKEMYVSFNIANIPSDMETREMTLYIPLQPVSGGQGKTLQAAVVREILTAWDEATIKTNRPRVGSFLSFHSTSDTISIDVQPYAHPWRFNSYDNHGVYVQLTQKQADFLQETVPWLVVSTI